LRSTKPITPPQRYWGPTQRGSDETVFVKEQRFAERDLFLGLWSIINDEAFVVGSLAS
jgi:hypothetical protein